MFDLSLSAIQSHYIICDRKFNPCLFISFISLSFFHPERREGPSGAHGKLRSHWCRIPPILSFRRRPDKIRMDPPFPLRHTVEKAGAYSRPGEKTDASPFFRTPDAAEWEHRKKKGNARAFKIGFISESDHKSGEVCAAPRSRPRPGGPWCRSISRQSTGRWPTTTIGSICGRGTWCSWTASWRESRDASRRQATISGSDSPTTSG